MKKILSSLLCLFIVVQSFAHLINPVTGAGACSKTGYVEVSGTDFDYTSASLDSVRFFITTTGNANVSASNPVIWDTAFFITNTNFNLYIKLLSSPENVFLEEYTRSSTHGSYSLQYFNFSANGDIKTQSGYGVIASTCVIAPVTLTNVSARLNNGVLMFQWTSTIESNNAYYIVEGSSDGSTCLPVGKVNSYWTNGTSATPHSYTFTYNDLMVIEAGAGLAIFIYLLIVGAFVYFIPKLMVKFEKYFMLLALILTLIITSCHKTNIVVTKEIVRYSYFRLAQTDLNGMVSYYQTIFKVN